MNALRALLLLLLASIPIERAVAQVDGAASQIVIPIVASTASFTSEIILKDQSGTSRSVTMQFYEAQTSITPGPKPCAAVSLAPFEVKTVTLAGQCTFTPQSHHGFVILTDASAARDKLFYAYSRVSNPQGIGFSVEGYPIGHLGGGETYSEVAGVKRKAALGGVPAFDTNCFVATLDDAVDYSISIDAAGAQPILGSLAPFQMRRYLDIYASAGATPGDYQNTTVTFLKDPGSFSATLLTFCTVQDNTSFGADFRIGKNWNAADPGRFRLNCFAAVYGSLPGECTSTLQPSAPQIPDAVTKVRLLTRVHAPDTVNCSLISSRAGELELRLVRDFPAAVVAGGNNLNAFSYPTGARSAIGSGYHQYYFLEVGPRAGVVGYPIAFGIRCMSGNGMTDPRFFGEAVHDF